MPDDPFLVWLTTMYLSAEEYRRLSVLPGAELAKTRRRVTYEGTVFAVDEFAGALHGLVLAETELPDGLDAVAAGELPPWLGREVTRDERFGGAALARHGLPPGWQL